jgi:hypothetical protein
MLKILKQALSQFLVLILLYGVSAGSDCNPPYTVAKPTSDNSGAKPIDSALALMSEIILGDLQLNGYDWANSDCADGYLEAITDPLLSPIPTF